MPVRCQLVSQTYFKVYIKNKSDWSISQTGSTKSNFNSSAKIREFLNYYSKLNDC